MPKLKINKISGFDYIDNKSESKKQIVLINTLRPFDDYLSSIKTRYNGKNYKVPHYIIKKDGTVFNLLNYSIISKIFRDEDVNKKIIVIAFENLGWLDKIPLKNSFINWIGNIYNGDVFEKKWRDYLYWDKYSVEQYESSSKLLETIINDTKIERKFVGHNTKVYGVQNFVGVVSRSNYENRFTDLNPSFDFEKIKKQIENE